MALPTGSVPLLEILKELRASEASVAYAETIIYESDLLSLLPTRAISGEALRSEEEVSLPTPLFRQFNDTYPNSDWGGDREHFWGTTIMGGEITVDNKALAQYGEARAKQRQTRKWAKASAGFLNKNIIDGTGAANSFKGLNALIADGFGQSYTFGADGFDPVVTGVEWLDEAQLLMRGTSADVILTNRRNRLSITNIGRGLTNTMIGVTEDSFGRKLSTWDGIPIITMGMDWQGNEILDFDETEGSSNASSSVYFLSLKDDDISLLLGNGGHFDFKDFGEVSEFPGHKMRFEVYPGLAVFNKFGVVRVTGVEVPA